MTKKPKGVPSDRLHGLAARKERVQKVAEMILQGLSVAQVEKLMKEKFGWEVTPEQLVQYVSLANEGFNQASRAVASTEFGKAMSRLNMLYAASMKINDYKTCLAVQKEINDLMGFTKTSEIVHSGMVTQKKEAKIIVEYHDTRKPIAKSEKEVDVRRSRIKVEDAVFEEISPEGIPETIPESFPPSTDNEQPLIRMSLPKQIEDGQTD